MLNLTDEEMERIMSTPYLSGEILTMERVHICNTEYRLAPEGGCGILEPKNHQLDELTKEGRQFILKTLDGQEYKILIGVWGNRSDQLFQVLN